MDTAPRAEARVRCVIPHWPAAQVRARVKLNLKNLYQANGFAVKELLKVAALLHQALRARVADDAVADAAVRAA